MELAEKYVSHIKEPKERPHQGRETNYWKQKIVPPVINFSFEYTLLNGKTQSQKMTIKLSFLTLFKVNSLR